MSDTPELLKIGDFAKLADTNLRTLRYYEELGLIEPASRSDGGFRYYRPTDANRVHMIRDLQELGLSLDRICELMGARHGHETREQFIARVKTALMEQEALLAARVQALEDQRKHVANALQKLAECQSCAHTPHRENNFCEPCGTTGQNLPRHLSALFQ